MRIAINTRLMIENKMDGIGWFTAETVCRMVEAHPDDEFYLFFDRKPSPNFHFPENTHIVVLGPPARHPVLWYLFFEWSVTRALRRYKIDNFISTDGWMSLRTKVPTLTVIHDINFVHTKGNLKASHQRYMDYFFPRFAQKAARIATVSDFSRTDIAQTWNIDSAKIDVVYDGAHSAYCPLTTKQQDEVRRRYTDGNPFFIFVSTIIRRKNLANLLLAFDKFKQTDTQGTRLVVAGRRVWWQDELKEAFDNMQHQSDVVFTGRIDTDQLALLMGSAVGLVYPSLFEGFGMPILEAFYSDTPVITSNVTSMPEIAGDSALLVDPLDVDAITDAMQNLSENEQLRSDLIERGRFQRAKFGWDITASLLWDSLMKIHSQK